MSLTDPTARPNRARTGWNGLSVVLLVLLLIAATTAGRMLGTAFHEGFDRTGAATELTGLVAALLGWVLLLGWLILGTARLLPVALGAGGAIALFGAVLHTTAGRSWMSSIWLAGLLIIGLGLFRRSQRSRRARDRQDVKQSGRLATATLTELDPPRPSTAASRGVIAIATFEFTDGQGQQRLVQRPLRIPRGTELPVGTTSQLWYDGQNPGHDRSIVVELSEQYPFPRRRNQ